MVKIRVNNVSFAYTTGADVLRGMSLEFDHRSTAIIGENGAGKTTLVKLLKGLLKPTSGDIYIHDRNTKETTAAQLSRTIGLVFQNPNDQIFKRTLLDEVMFGPLNMKLDERAARNKALQALELVGLQEKQGQNPHDLGLSEKKLVTIASVVAMDTDIIIFDEPTIAQDYAGKQKIRQIIEILRKQGKLVITIIHDMEFVAENFERTIVLQQGKAAIDASTREVFSQKELLREANLDIPYVTQLAEKLGISQTILTAREFKESYMERLSRSH